MKSKISNLFIIALVVSIIFSIYSQVVISKKNKEINQLNNQISSLEDDKRELENDLSQAKDQIQDLENELSDCQSNNFQNKLKINSLESDKFFHNNW